MSCLNKRWLYAFASGSFVTLHTYVFLLQIAVTRQILFAILSRYFRVARNVKANEKEGLQPREDFIYAKAKAKAIVDRFLDSDVAPKNQVSFFEQLICVLVDQ